MGGSHIRNTNFSSSYIVKVSKKQVKLTLTIHFIKTFYTPSITVQRACSINITSRTVYILLFIIGPENSTHISYLAHVTPSAHGAGGHHGWQHSL